MFKISQETYLQQHNKLIVFSLFCILSYFLTFNFLVNSIIVPIYLIYNSLCLLDIQNIKNKSIDCNKLNIRMLKMWILYGCLLTFENVISFVNIPFYGILKLLFLIWLYITKRGEEFYDNYIYYQFMNHRELLDNLYQYMAIELSFNIFDLLKDE